MIVTAFVWWFTFAAAVAACIGAVGVLCTFGRHKRVGACVVAVLVGCAGFAGVGVTVSHAIVVCATNDKNGC